MYGMRLEEMSNVDNGEKQGAWVEESRCMSERQQNMWVKERRKPL